MESQPDSQPASQLRLQRWQQTLVLSNAWHTHAHTHPPTVRKSCVRDETSGKVRRCSGAFLEMPLSSAVLLALDWPFLTWLPDVCRCRLQAVCRGTDFCVESGGAGRGVAAFRHPAAGRSHGRLGRYREPKSKVSQQRGVFVQLCKVQNASFSPLFCLPPLALYPSDSIFVCLHCSSAPPPPSPSPAFSHLSPLLRSALPASMAGYSDPLGPQISGAGRLGVFPGMLPIVSS